MRRKRVATPPPVPPRPDVSRVIRREPIDWFLVFFIAIIVATVATIGVGLATGNLKLNLNQSNLRVEHVQTTDGRTVECVIPRRGLSGTPDCDWQNAR